MNEPRYQVTLHHLAPDASSAGLNYPDAVLKDVPAPQLAGLLRKFADLAAQLSIYEPSMPEIRVKGELGSHVVRTSRQQLSFADQDAALPGKEQALAYVLATISGAAPGAVSVNHTVPPFAMMPAARPAPVAAPPPPPSLSPAAQPKRAKRGGLVACIVLIVAVNAGSVWMLLRPAPGVGPAYELLAEAESDSLLLKTAGEYQTGDQRGDRHLVIARDGALTFAKFGPGLALTESRTRPSVGATVADRRALVTTDRSPLVVEIKDADTLIVTGTTYRRVVR